MKSKKKVSCLKCKYYDGANCHQNGNIGILIKSRTEHRFYLKTPEELNKDCKSYAKT